MWTLVTLAAVVVSFLLGYGVSSNTGVEPGYFEAAEAGGYGGGGGGGDAAGLNISKDAADYYKDLMK